LVWWFRSSLHCNRESVKRTSEPTTLEDLGLLASFPKFAKKLPQEPANFGFGTPVTSSCRHHRQALSRQSRRREPRRPRAQRQEQRQVRLVRQARRPLERRRERPAQRRQQPHPQQRRPPQPPSV